MRKKSLSQHLASVKRDIQQNGFCPKDQISIYSSQGVGVKSGRPCGNPTGKGGGKRGKVVTWSKASRRRMRNFLLTRAVKNGDTYGVTLTIPGPPVSVQVAREMFSSFRQRCEKAGLAFVWRIEIQKRGQLHWHLCLSTPNNTRVLTAREIWIYEVVKLGWVTVWYDSEKHDKIVESWKEGEDYELEPSYETVAGEVYPGIVDDQLDLFEGVSGTRAIISFANRYMLPGAKQHIFQCDDKGRNGSWFRYMCDHATKAKQEQIPVNIGRHWGVVGRKHYEEVAPSEVCTMSNREYVKVCRWMSRLCTPRIPDKRAPFGRRSGFQRKIGRTGETLLFTRPETVRRMVDYVKQESRSARVMGQRGQSAKASKSG